MATLRDAKLLGGIGAILLFIPFVSIVGLVLVLVAMKYVSDATNDPSIWDNTLYAVILTIIGTVVGIVFFILPLMGYGIITGGFSPGFPFDLFGSIILIAGLAVIWVFVLIAAVFWKRSLDSTAAHTNVEIFATAGLLYLIGAALVIIVVGIFLVFVAHILLIVGFFTLPEEQAPAPVASAPPPV